MIRLYSLLALLLALLVGCGGGGDQTAEQAAPEAAPAARPAQPTGELISSVLAKQPADVKERYQWRNPQQTLEFFGIKPGMTVVEALPGGGWYTKILIDVLGPEGSLIGADYALEMWPLFGFFSEEMLEDKKTWVTDWTEMASGWRGESSAPVSAFVFGSMPDEIAGTADAVLLVRAMHNLRRFEDQGQYLTNALADAYNVLKPGGVLGIVQHHAPDANSDEFADGSHGYLKKTALTQHVIAAGFLLDGSSDVNANPADQPGEEDVVWRLPPTLATSREDEALREQMIAIGESNRMTLRFRKPAG